MDGSVCRSKRVIQSQYFSLIGWHEGTAALKTIPASRASIAATFEPVAAALFGLVLFGQKMDGFGVAGIVCEIAALVLLQLPAPAKRKG